MTIDEKANAIRTMVVGALVADYGARLIVDGTTHELKQLINNVLKSVRSVERHFLFHDNTDAEYREVFKRQFVSNTHVLIAELVQTVWGLSEDTLEDIIRAIKANIEEAKTIAEQPK